MPSNLNPNSKRERVAVIVIPLLLFQLALLSVQIQNPGGMAPIKMLLLSIQGPIIHAASGVSRAVRDVWENYLWLVGARIENKKMQERMRQLIMLNRSYEEILKENDRLRRLLSMNEQLEYKTIGARVIARTPDFLTNVIYVDRGAKDGVRVDSPVVSWESIIGRIVYVAENQSEVQLITNPDASIGVMMEDTHTPGVLRGTGERMLDLNYISNAEEIHDGEIVLTSGLDGIFPKPCRRLV